MYAVFRETVYGNDVQIEQTDAFKTFQVEHSKQPGYIGTVVTNIAPGHYLTITLWKTKKDMDDARRAIGSTVENLLEPLMVSPAKLLGTGKVVMNDMVNTDQSNSDPK